MHTFIAKPDLLTSETLPHTAVSSVKEEEEAERKGKGPTGTGIDDPR